MTTLRQAAEQVLDWLYNNDILHPTKVSEDLRAALAEPTCKEDLQVEPVAWMDREGDLYNMPEIKNWAPPHTMLYAAPPQREWVGLTDEERRECMNWAISLDNTTYSNSLARAIEAKLKEKNT